jgi:conjugal transfer pilus assembly protein TraW
MKLSALLLLCGSEVLAKDLGQHGNVYPIGEHNLLDVMVHRANQMQQTGELKMRQEEMRVIVENQMKHPIAIPGLEFTDEERITYVDLSVMSTSPIIDKNGNVLMVQGRRINPLDVIDFSDPLYFIDGTKTQQVKWALKDGGQNAVILLVKGSVFDLMSKYDARFYFDQDGSLVKRLGIKQVPAKVESIGDKLKVHEVII